MSFSAESYVQISRTKNKPVQEGGGLKNAVATADPASPLASSNIAHPPTNDPDIQPFDKPQRLPPESSRVTTRELFLGVAPPGTPPHGSIVTPNPRALQHPSMETPIDTRHGWNTINTGYEIRSGVERVPTVVPVAPSHRPVATPNPRALQHPSPEIPIDTRYGWGTINTGYETRSREESDPDFVPVTWDVEAIFCNPYSQHGKTYILYPGQPQPRPSYDKLFASVDMIRNRPQ
ncbi:hypothetical protein K440DRAFT_641558 [Wilcoxina mikolae CBS 423.85]|nr:hypothetical protein K440DRAFT_641558 [Wilcoxina mikolae CBS 423.85]